MRADNLAYQWGRRFAGLASLMLSAALLLPAAVTAHAATDQVIFGTNFQETTDIVSNAPPADTGCTSTSLCYIVFSPVPTGKRLIVTQLSCRLFASAGEIDGAFLKYQKPDTSFPLPQHNMLPVPSPAANFYVLNETTFALFTQARRPIVILTSTAAANMSGTCTISGQLIDP